MSPVGGERHRQHVVPKLIVDPFRPVFDTPQDSVKYAAQTQMRPADYGITCENAIVSDAGWRRDQLRLVFADCRQVCVRVKNGMVCVSGEECGSGSAAELPFVEIEVAHIGCSVEVWNPREFFMQHVVGRRLLWVQPYAGAVYLGFASGCVILGLVARDAESEETWLLWSESQ